MFDNFSVVEAKEGKSNFSSNYLGDRNLEKR